MLPETNRTIYLKLSLTEYQTNCNRDKSDEQVVFEIFYDMHSELDIQPIYNVIHES